MEHWKAEVNEHLGLSRSEAASDEAAEAAVEDNQVIGLARFRRSDVLMVIILISCTVLKVTKLLRRGTWIFSEKGGLTREKTILERLFSARFCYKSKFPALVSVRNRLEKSWESLIYQKFVQIREVLILFSL